MSMLIVYYSLDKNTELLAKLIAKETGADTAELKPIKPYPKSGPAKMIVGGCAAISGDEPKLIDIPDVSKYDTLFLGSPVWAGTFSPPMKTFLKNADLNGKRIAIFVSHSGGTPDGCIRKFKEELEKCEIIGEIGVISPLKKKIDDLENTVHHFVASLGII